MADSDKINCENRGRINILIPRVSCSTQNYDV